MSEWEKIKVKKSPGYEPEKERKMKALNHKNAIALFLSDIGTKIDDVMLEDEKHVFRYDSVYKNFEDIDSLLDNPENIKAKFL